MKWQYMFAMRRFDDGAGGLVGHRQYIAINAPFRGVVSAAFPKQTRDHRNHFSIPGSSAQLTRILPKTALNAECRTFRIGEQVKRGLTVAVAGAAILAAGISGCSSNKSTSGSSGSSSGT